MRIVFTWRAVTTNTGDAYASPAACFPWPDTTVVPLGEPIPRADAVIYGGGIVHARLIKAREHLAAPVRVRIAWGIGVSERGRMPQDIPLPDGFDLLGVRDFGRERLLPGALYVPCASCMLPHFDRVWPVTRDVVGFINADRRIRAPQLHGLRVLTNDQPLDGIISWLASAEVVVTNSYHGAYWATLLGRRVVCIPYSSKFFGFKFAPALATDGDWRAHLSRAPSHPAALESSRAANRAFFGRVRELIGF